MLFQFLVLFAALAITAIALGWWVALIVLWKRKVVRYVLLPLAAAGTWISVAFWTSDADSTPAANAWIGRYALDTCTSVRPMPNGWNGPLLSIAKGQVCRLQDAPGRAAMIGEWHYVTAEDRPYLELIFPGHPSVRIIGGPGELRTIGTFPLAECP